MNCTEVRELLSEFVEEDLAREAGNAVREHLVACDPCARELTDLRQLIELAAAQSLAVEPERDLWLQIRSSAERPWYAQYLPSIGGGVLTPRGAALIAACLVIGVAAVLLRAWPAGSPVESEGVQVSREVSLDYGASSELAHSEDGTLRSWQDLEVAVQRLPEDLPGQSRVAVVEGRAAIDDAVGEIRVALEADPDNTKLQHLLAARYRQEVGFLKQVSRL